VVWKVFHAKSHRHDCGYKRWSIWAHGIFIGEYGPLTDGFRHEEYFMKCLAVAVVCAVALSGCGKSSNQKPSVLAKIEAAAELEKAQKAKEEAEKAAAEQTKQDAGKQASQPTAQPTTTQPAPQKTQPSKIEPAKTEPTKIEPAKTEPVKADVKPAAKTDEKKADAKKAEKPVQAKTADKKADTKKADAKKCQVESDGADIMKLNMQLKDATKRYNVEKANFDVAAKSNNNAGMLSSLENADQISAAAVASCEKVLKNHEKTAQQCASNKTLVSELNSAKKTCDSYAKNNAAIKNSLAQINKR
jgi:hypothetical protein